VVVESNDWLTLVTKNLGRKEDKEKKKVGHGKVHLSGAVSRDDEDGVYKGGTFKKARG